MGPLDDFMVVAACPAKGTCDATYLIDRRRIQPSGIQLRCRKCGTCFLFPQPPPPPKKLQGLRLYPLELKDGATRPKPTGRSRKRYPGHSRNPTP
jgi:hypothetical protein